jgi:predicted lipoprotein with Yx(FWY)xxD motif
MIRWLLPVAVIAAIGAGAAMAATNATHSSAPAVKMVDSAKFGNVLINTSGRTLYRYTIDSKGVNRCTSVAVCNKYWPPLLVKGTGKPTAGTGVKASLLGTIKAKAAGMRQVTYAGFPLYTFAGDSKAGQVNGEGFQKQWYVVNEKGALVKTAIKSGTPAPSYPATTTPSSGSAWG